MKPYPLRFAAACLASLAVACGGSTVAPPAGLSYSANPAAYVVGTALLPNGKVLVVGGMDAADVPIASAELYDPGTGRFTFTASISPRLAAVGASDSALLERKGPSAVFLAPAGSAASSSAGTRAVAVNVRSGQLGILTGTISGKASSAEVATAAANATGVPLAYFAESIGYAFFRVPAGGDALTAAAALRARPGMTGLEVEVRESFPVAE